MFEGLQDIASEAIVCLARNERIGKPMLHNLSRVIGKMVNECNTLMIANEDKLCQNLENLYFGFWIQEQVALRHISIWACKEGSSVALLDMTSPLCFDTEVCLDMSEQLNKIGADSIPMISCYTYRILALLSSYCERSADQCKQLQFTNLSSLMSTTSEK